MLKQFRMTKVPSYTGAGAVYPYTKALETKFTFKSRFDEEVQMFARKGDNIILPRGVCPMGADKRSSGGYVEFDPMVLGPRDDEQQRLFDESFALLQDDVSHVLQASTGVGKTFLGMWLAQALGLKTLIVVPKEDIKTQWRDAAMKFCGLTKNDIGLIQADKCDIVGKKIVIGMVQSLSKDKYPAHVKREFGLVIFDEVHIMGAKEFSKAAALFNSKLRLGLSATPYRADGKDVVFKAHIGETLVINETLMMIPKVIRINSEYKLPRVIKTVINEKTGKPQRVRMPMEVPAGKCMHVFKMLAKDVVRNTIIVEFAAEAYKKGRRIIIFSDLRDDHLGRLHPMLRAHGIPDSDIAYYVGGMKEAEREEAKSKRVLLATYKMASMATDIPWLDTAIFCTPRSDVVQIMGRILRESPDKRFPLALDVLDPDVETFRKYAIRRQVWYKKIGAEVLEREG